MVIQVASVHQVGISIITHKLVWTKFLQINRYLIGTGRVFSLIVSGKLKCVAKIIIHRLRARRLKLTVVPNNTLQVVGMMLRKMQYQILTHLLLQIIQAPVLFMRSGITNVF